MKKIKEIGPVLFMLIIVLVIAISGIVMVEKGYRENMKRYDAMREDILRRENNRKEWLNRDSTFIKVVYHGHEDGKGWKEKYDCRISTFHTRDELKKGDTIAVGVYDDKCVYPHKDWYLYHSEHCHYLLVVVE